MVGATGGGLNLDGSIGDVTVQDGDACGSATIPSDVEITPGNVLVLFDQSLTMGDPWQDPSGTSKPKWLAASDAFVAAVGPILGDLNLGAIFFPTTEATSLFDLCTAQSAPIASAPPQIPISPGATFGPLWSQHFQAPWTLILGTPLNRALDNALLAVQDPSLVGITVVVIFTDGQWTCIDSTEAGNVAALFAQGIKTYIVGLPGALGATGLDQLAQAGGTAAPGCTTNCFLLPADTAQLEQQLAQIAQTTVSIDSCVITLDPPPPDPSQVHLIVTDSATGNEYEVLLSEGGPDGWTLSPDGKTATLTGSTCDDAKSGAFSSLRFEYGCVSVPPLPA